MAYYDFLNVIFGPLLNLPAWLTILIISVIFSFLNLLITKYASDQQAMKRVKEQVDEYRKKIKELKKDSSKQAEMQKTMLDMNKLSLEQLRYSFKPLIITSIPIIFLLIPWMNAVFAYESIKPQQEFSVAVTFNENANGEAELIVPEGINVIGAKIKEIQNNKAEFKLKGEEGEHLLEVAYKDEKQQKNVLITTENKYAKPIESTEGIIKSIQINYKKLVVIPIGYKDWFGWLGTYIIFSIIFTMGLRKVMKVY